MKANQDCFCEGMVQEIINALTALKGLHVASLSIPSWNQILAWLRQMDLLRKASGQAA